MGKARDFYFRHDASFGFLLDSWLLAMRRGGTRDAHRLRQLDPSRSTTARALSGRR